MGSVREWCGQSMSAFAFGNLEVVGALPDRPALHRLL